MQKKLKGLKKDVPGQEKKNKKSHIEKDTAALPLKIQIAREGEETKRDIVKDIGHLHPHNLIRKDAASIEGRLHLPLRIVKALKIQRNHQILND